MYVDVTSSQQHAKEFSSTGKRIKFSHSGYAEFPIELIRFADLEGLQQLKKSVSCELGLADDIVIITASPFSWQVPSVPSVSNFS